MRAGLLLTAAMIACSSPPPPTIPPREEIGPPLPAANDCFPPYPNNFGQAYFILADLDRAVSCRVFLEQDECVLGIFDDCTDPSPTSRQWIGQIDTEMVRNLVQFQLYEGGGTAPGARLPKCCSGEVIDNDWAVLDCKQVACDNLQDKLHVGMVLEREETPAPFAIAAGREQVSGASKLFDFALLASKEEIWTISQSEILVHELGGVTRSLATVTDAKHLVASPDENTIYVADGTKLHRIDVAARQIAETITLEHRIELLEHTSRGILVGSSDGREMTLSLRRHDAIGTIDAQETTMRLAAITEIPNGTMMRAFMAAPLMGDLIVLTATLTPSNGPHVDKPPRAFIPIDANTIGYLAECSSQSSERHCFFELTLPNGPIRRTGIPDIGEIAGAAHHAATDRVIFSGESGLGVLERSEWRPLVQQRVEATELGALALDGEEIYAIGADGAVERFTLR